jgi:hypothetical protein
MLWRLCCGVGGAGVLADGGGVRKVLGFTVLRMVVVLGVTMRSHWLSIYTNLRLLGRACREKTQGGPWVRGRFGVHGRWRGSNNFLTQG